MTSEWHSTQEFESDLYAFSEMEGATKSEIDVAPLPTILEWNARLGINSSPSIFDIPAPQEDVTYVISGRGRGGFSSLIKPGAGTAPQTNRNVDADLQKKIREVSGMGYSNQLIVQSMPSMSGNKTKTDTANVKLQPTQPLTLSPSRRSTPNSTVLQSAMNLTRPSPRKSEGSDSLSGSSSTSPLSESFSSDAKPEEAVENTPTPPLRVMLNRAKKPNELPPKSPMAKMKENKNIESNMQVSINSDENIGPNRNHLDHTMNNNDNWWRNRDEDSSSDSSNCWRRRDGNSPNRYFGGKNERNSSKYLNISSSTEFPALK